MPNTYVWSNEVNDGMGKQLPLMKPQCITHRKQSLLNESWSHAYLQTEKRQNVYVEQQSSKWEKCSTHSIWRTLVTFSTPWRIADDNVWKQEQYDYHTLIQDSFLLILSKLLHFWLLLNSDYIWHCYFNDVDVFDAADHGVDDAVAEVSMLFLMMIIEVMMILFLLLMVMLLVRVSVTIAMLLFLMMIICCCCCRWW